MLLELESVNDLDKEQVELGILEPSFTLLNLRDTRDRAEKRSRHKNVAHEKETNT